MFYLEVCHYLFLVWICAHCQIIFKAYLKRFALRFSFCRKSPSYSSLCFGLVFGIGILVIATFVTIFCFKKKGRWCDLQLALTFVCTESMRCNWSEVECRWSQRPTYLRKNLAKVAEFRPIIVSWFDIKFSCKVTHEIF